MELVRGVRITEFCDQHQLPTVERLKLFIQVCHAIQHAHQKGIIHRDIKPSNILVSLHDDVPVPKVIDFGIAKAIGERLTDKTLYTRFEQFIGTPAYMSPEQAGRSDLDIDTRTDIYALGVLLYELLTGSTPFDTQELLKVGLEEMLRTIREVEPIKPSTRLTRELSKVRKWESEKVGESAAPAVESHSPTFPPAYLQWRRQKDIHELQRLIPALRGDLDWIVMKCLEKNRTRRYETANGLAQDIEAHLNHEVVMARPPSTAYRLGKFVRRNKMMVSAASAVAGALVLGIVGSTWQATVATQARRTAETARGESEVAQKQTDAERSRAERQLYAAKLNLVQREWEQNVGRVRQLLGETASHPERGFEWYYWQRQIHRELMILHGHGGPLSSVAFSPDGRRIVTGNKDLTAKVWDAGSGRELLTLKGHSATIYAVAFSPDGQRIVSGSGDATAKVWEAATGRELLTLKGHLALIRGAAFSPDGQRIATGSWDQTAKVWDSASGVELLTLRGHRKQVLAVAFSPDGQRIATGSWDTTAKLWDTASGKELLTLKGHTEPIRSVAFSSNGQWIVTGSHDRTAKVWDAASGKEWLTLYGHADMIRPAVFSADGKRIVTGSHDQTTRVWDALSGKELLTVRGHTAGIRGVAFSPDGQRIVTGSEDGTAKVWEAGDRFILSGHRGVILSVAFSPDGHRIVTGSLDQTAKVWDLASGRQLLTLEGHHGGIRSVAFSPDGQRVLTGSWDQTAKLWEAASGRELLTLIGHTGGIRSVAFAPDSRRVATGSGDHTAKLWEATSGKELLTFRGHAGAIRGVAFSPDGQRIVTGSEDQTAKVWEVVSGKGLLTLKGHKVAVNCVAFSPDGQKVATGSGDQTTGQRAPMESNEAIAMLWELASGKPLLTLKGHSGVINSVAFSPDGQRIITGSGDQTAKVWEVAGGSELLTLKGHRVSEGSAEINSVAFSPDGQRIVTGSSDQTVRVWEAATSSQVATWLQEEEAATQCLAILEREQVPIAERNQPLRAAESTAIKQWLVLAPIPFEDPSGAVALMQEQIVHEGQLRPRAGDRVKVGEKELVWSEVQLTDALIDFTQLLGGPGHSSLAYAVCYLQAERRETGLLLKVRSDDLARMYLNGDEIYRHTATRGQVPDPDVVKGVELNAGINVVVFKVLVEIGPTWEGSVWLTDAAGQPVKGIEVTLTPPADR
jgi:WD40 repeat protein